MTMPRSKSDRRTKKPRPQKPDQLPAVSDGVRPAYPHELQALERRLKDRQQKFTVGMRERVVDWIRDLPGCCCVPDNLTKKIGENQALDIATEISEAYRDWLMATSSGPIISSRYSR